MAYRKCRRILEEIVTAAVDVAQADAAIFGVASLPRNAARLFGREIGGIRDVEEEEEEMTIKRRRGERLEEKSARGKQEQRRLRVARREFDDYRELEHDVWVPPEHLAPASWLELRDERKITGGPVIMGFH